MLFTKLILDVPAVLIIEPAVSNKLPLKFSVEVPVLI